MSIVVASTGQYIPQKRKSVMDIAVQNGIDPNSIKKTGHRYVSVANDEDTPSYMAARASESALDQAQIEGKDIDVIIYCGSHKDYGKWQAATKVQESIGNRSANCFDLYQGCNTPLLAVSIAQSMIQFGAADRVLIVASERWDGCTLDHMLTPSIYVGDGAGALIVCHESLTVRPLLKPLAFSFESNGEFNDLWYIRQGGTNQCLMAEESDDHLYKVQRSLNEEELKYFQSLASSCSKRLLENCLMQSGLTWSEIQFIVMMNGNASHNRHYLKSVGGENKSSSSHYLGDVGHLGGADFILNIERMITNDDLALNQNCLVYSGGSGYSWATAIFQRIE